MRYTKLVPSHNMELSRIIKEPFDIKVAFQDPTVFAHHILKITPYRYQHEILRNFKKDIKNAPKRLITCKSRQMGISVCLALLAIWYSATGQVQTGIHNNTKVGIISRSDIQAKKLMAEIQSMVFSSPELSPLIVSGRRSPLSKSEMHFRGGWIKSYPPTDACRGESFDLLIVDEAAFVDADLFKDAMEPTVSATDGIIILSSTPKGQKGFFFETFDPDDVHKEHEYKRYWFHWRMCENVIQKKLIEHKMKISLKTGNYKSFQQEYDALFTVDAEAFFENADVEKGVDNNLAMVYNQDCPVSVGLDYGGSQASTCITVVGKIGPKLELLYQFSAKNFDENLLMDPNWEHSFPNLKKRYKNFEHVVVDDCPQGTRTNKQLENEGYPLIRYNFIADSYKGERNRGYYMFRNALKNGRIKYPRINSLISEMKSVDETMSENQKFMRIKSPRGFHEDRVDSLMMACYPFLNDENTFSSDVIETPKDYKLKEYNPRIDTEWNKVFNKGYDFLK